MGSVLSVLYGCNSG